LTILANICSVVAVLDQTPQAGILLGVAQGRLAAWHVGWHKIPGRDLLLRLEIRVERDDDWRYLDDIEEPLRGA
jgi:hypothetical protein